MDEKKYYEELEKIKERVQEMEKQILILEKSFISAEEFKELKNRFTTLEIDYMEVKNAVVNLSQDVIDIKDTSKDTNKKMDKLMEITMRQETDLKLAQKSVDTSEKVRNFIFSAVGLAIIGAVLKLVIIG